MRALVALLLLAAPLAAQDRETVLARRLAIPWYRDGVLDHVENITVRAYIERGGNVDRIIGLSDWERQIVKGEVAPPMRMMVLPPPVMPAGGRIRQASCSGGT